MTTDRGPLGTLTGRTVLLTALVAVIAAVVTTLVAVPLINNSARSQALATVGRLADISASALRDPTRPDTPTRLRELLQSQNVTAYLVGTDLQPPPGLTREDIAALVGGDELSESVTVGGADYLVVGRKLSQRFGLVLYAPNVVAADPAAQGLRQLLAALVVGVVVAVLIGFWAARRVTRPLTRAADVAERLSAGERGITASPEGPAEVGDIVTSLNHLSQALDVSEGRQREFLLSVSHELRTPLTAIRGYAEAIADGMVPEAEVPASAAVMSAETERLDRLVADLLDLAKLGAVDFRIEPTDVDLTTLCREAARVWASRCTREGVEFTAEVPPGSLLVRSDPMRVRQIIDNLAENALRVTPPGGPIVLSAGFNGPEAVVTVRDGGPGLTESDMAVAFEPAALYTRYRGIRTVGSGVGLALVGRLATRLGGSARVARAPEGGAAFSVSLPRVLPVPSPVSSASAH